LKTQIEKGSKVLLVEKSEAQKVSNKRRHEEKEKEKESSEEEDDEEPPIKRTRDKTVSQ